MQRPVKRCISRGAVMLFESTVMGHFYPCPVHWPVKANHRIHSASGTDCCLVLRVSIAPLCDFQGRKLRHAVITNRHLTREQRLAMH